MNSTQRQHDWNSRVSVFNAENAGRPTRLGVFERSNGSVNDYWLENGLTLRGVSFEERNDHVVAQILLDGFTHVVENAERIELVYGSNGFDEGLNVIDSEGRTAILRFD